MTIAEAIDKKSNRPTPSRNIMDAIAYYFEQLERMGISDNIKPITGHNITKAIDEYSGKGDQSHTIVEAIDNLTGQGPSKNIMDAISKLDSIEPGPDPEPPGPEPPGPEPEYISESYIINENDLDNIVINVAELFAEYPDEYRDSLYFGENAEVILIIDPDSISSEEIITIPPAYYTMTGQAEKVDTLSISHNTLDPEAPVFSWTAGDIIEIRINKITE